MYATGPANGPRDVRNVFLVCYHGLRTTAPFSSLHADSHASSMEGPQQLIASMNPDVHCSHTSEKDTFMLRGLIEQCVTGFCMLMCDTYRAPELNLATKIFEQGMSEIW
jgi:hypothetical protein